MENEYIRLMPDGTYQYDYKAKRRDELEAAYLKAKEDKDWDRASRAVEAMRILG